MLSRERLQRRVIFLFSDGEEQALLGAYAFANTDPLMEEVESLVDLEARGSRGPAVFFESNQPNADAVAAYSAVSRPVANSVMADVYRLLPNSTDVTALTRPGLDVIIEAAQDSPRVAGKAVAHRGSNKANALQQFAGAARLLGFVQELKHAVRQSIAARVDDWQGRDQAEVAC